MFRVHEVGTKRNPDEGIMRSIIFALVVCLLGSGTAIAQAPPMSMNWAMQNQMRMQQFGNASAWMAGQLCARYILQMRLRGYRGPISCGADQQSMENAINGLNGEYDRYNRAWGRNNRNTINAEDNYDWGAVRGCERVWNPYYQRWYHVCP